MKCIYIEFEKVEAGQPFAIEIPTTGDVLFCGGVLIVGIEGNGSRFYYDVKSFRIHD